MLTYYIFAAATLTSGLISPNIFRCILKPYMPDTPGNIVVFTINHCLFNQQLEQELVPKFRSCREPPKGFGLALFKFKDVETKHSLLDQFIFYPT